ncbi:hypothetical protein [Corallococcus sp. EGB]|uniref:hypothetical protein n=1 Tax=Corallococcus sp. EGB TaxID=1521117 RepID=UPI001CBE4F38|nr:hypothetical protein [Corallococcus sp. EGB]
MGSVWKTAGLVLLGAGLAACRSDPGGGGDAGTEVDAGAPVQTVAQGATLLEVDARQTFLLSVRADGTYAQPLPEGAPSRISDKAERAVIASDGGAVVLWSPQQDHGLTRSVWLWRPGTDAALALTSRAWNVAYDTGVSFVAFNEYDDASGTNSVRVVQTDACTPQSCSPRTAIERPSRDVRFQAGGRSLLVSEGRQAWLVSDVSSGGVTALGTTEAEPVLSPDGARHVLFDAANHLQVFDTATRALLWEQAWRDEATRKDWHVSSAFMTGAGTVIVNIQADRTPETGSVACDATGCRDVEGGVCRSWEGSPGAVVCLINRCPSPDFCRSEAAYLDGLGRTLIDTATASQSSVYPAFSADLQRQAWTTRETRDGAKVDTLWWRSPEGTLQSPLEGLADSNLFMFTPGARQVLFARTVTTADGKAGHRLSLWDGAAVSDVAVLEGPPYSNPLSPKVRDNPLALYLTVSQGPGGAPAVIRAALP